MCMYNMIQVFTYTKTCTDTHICNVHTYIQCGSVPAGLGRKRTGAQSQWLFDSSCSAVSHGAHLLKSNAIKLKTFEIAKLHVAFSAPTIHCAEGKQKCLFATGLVKGGGLLYQTYPLLLKGSSSLASALHMMCISPLLLHCR